MISLLHRLRTLLSRLAGETGCAAAAPAPEPMAEPVITSIAPVPSFIKPFANHDPDDCPCCRGNDHNARGLQKRAMLTGKSRQVGKLLLAGGLPGCVLL